MLHFLLHFLPDMPKFELSRGSATTCWRYGGRYYTDFVENSLVFPALKEFWKSVKNWQSYRHEFGVVYTFLGQCRCCLYILCGLSRLTSLFTCQAMFVIITTLSIHHSFTLSLQAPNLPIQQILPTLIDFSYTLGLPSRIIALDRTYLAHRFIFSSFDSVHHAIEFLTAR